MYEKYSGTAEKLNEKSQYCHTNGISKSRLKRIAHFVASTAYTRTHLPSTLTHITHTHIQYTYKHLHPLQHLLHACVTQRPTE